MGNCCCKQYSNSYSVLDKHQDNGNKKTHRYQHNQKKEKKQKKMSKSLSDIYKKYAKKICRNCNKVKYGRCVNSKYGEEFMCIDCVVDINRKTQQTLSSSYKVNGRYS